MIPAAVVVVAVDDGDDDDDDDEPILGPSCGFRAFLWPILGPSWAHLGTGERGQGEAISKYVVRPGCDYGFGYANMVYWCNLQGIVGSATRILRNI